VEWPLFADVPEAEVRELLQIARRRRFSVVFRQDDPRDSLHLIVKGRFAIQNHDSARGYDEDRNAGPGESLGEIALVTIKARRAATIAELEEGETLGIHPDDFARVRVGKGPPESGPFVCECCSTSRP
jgi:CRP-like cAMP-binding protein